MSFGGPRGEGVRPPEKGSFPLDHGGECKPKMRELLACLRAHNNDHIRCKELSRAYLECRMQRGLMQDENLDALGFSEAEMRAPEQPTEAPKRREAEGFVAGANLKRRR